MRRIAAPTHTSFELRMFDSGFFELNCETCSGVFNIIDLKNAHICAEIETIDDPSVNFDQANYDEVISTPKQIEVLSSIVLKKARAVRKKPKRFNCSDCDRSFTRKENLTSHINAVHLKLRPYKCSECGRSFARKGHLNIHTKLVHEDTKIECSHCHNKYRSLDRHAPEKGFTCRQRDCEENLSCYIKLMEHKDSHVNWPCDQCEKSLIIEPLLKLHKLRHHRIYECKISGCTTTFTGFNARNYHQTSVHPNQICNCGRRYYGTLEEHEINHGRHCVICFKAFKTQNERELHQKSHGVTFEAILEDDNAIEAFEDLEDEEEINVQTFTNHLLSKQKGQIYIKFNLPGFPSYSNKSILGSKHDHGEYPNDLTSGFKLSNDLKTISSTVIVKIVPGLFNFTLWAYESNDGKRLEISKRPNQYLQDPYSGKLGKNDKLKAPAGYNLGHLAQSAGYKTAVDHIKRNSLYNLFMADEHCNQNTNKLIEDHMRNKISNLNEQGSGSYISYILTVLITATHGIPKVTFVNKFVRPYFILKMQCIVDDDGKFKVQCFIFPNYSCNKDFMYWEISMAMAEKLTELRFLNIDNCSDKIFLNMADHKPMQAKGNASVERVTHDELVKMFDMVEGKLKPYLSKL